jgi:Holliday junction resolvase RusA-like endonuclease
VTVLHDFIVRGRPRTPQTRSPKPRADWKQRVTAAALQHWPPDRPPIDDEVAIAIVYFYPGETNLDVDAIAKLIIDSLEGAVITNDRIVSQAFIRKTEQEYVQCLENPPVVLARAIEPERIRLCSHRRPA